jgi:hypothetical protein
MDGISLSDIAAQLRQLSADHANYRAEQARNREKDLAEMEQHRKQDREYLNGRLAQLEHKIDTVSNCNTTSSSQVSKQSSLSFNSDLEPEEGNEAAAALWQDGQPPWAPECSSATETSPSAELWVLPLDNPNQCPLCRYIFRHKR